MKQPLCGIRIVTLAEQYPGPFATLVMADLGAEVIIVERDAGDPSRQFPGFHSALNRNKKSVVLDLKTAAGKESLGNLLKNTDVLLEGFRPGTMARLGFGYEAVSAINHRIVYASISGFGQTGPYRDRPAHDLSYQAMAGLLFRQAASDRVEPLPELAIGDLSSAMFTVVGVLSALLRRTDTGKGGYIDVSMTDALVSLMTTFLAPTMNRQELVSINGEPAYGVFRCADRKWLTLSIAHEDWFWKPLCAMLDMEDVAVLLRPERLAREQELRGRIADCLEGKTRSEWGAAFDRADIPWGPVNSIEEVVSDPHFQERGLYRKVANATGQTSWHVAQPLIIDGVHPGPSRGVSVLGADSEEVLSRVGIKDPK